MKLAVITPVGPGHDEISKRAIQSVAKAKPGQFSSVRHVIVDDYKGRLGRSHARNLGMTVDADWYFFLDADDKMREDALMLNDFAVSATFGAVSLDGKITKENVFPCGWNEIAKHGSLGTLSMGFFCRADVARRLRFNESMDAGEDFDFYMRLPDFTKVASPLVDIGYSLPSAGGPRGYEKIDWTEICNRVINDFGRDAVLAKAERSKTKPGSIREALSETRH